MKFQKTIFTALGFLMFISSYGQADSSSNPQIGSHFGGGIVFDVDDSGEHGLIAAPHDQTTNKVRWGWNGITNALSVDNGQLNTKRIVAFHEARKNKQFCAAKYCDTLSIGGYNDWYLPAINELHKLYKLRHVLGGFLAGDYCSSTEYGKKDAYHIHFKPHKRVEFYYNKVDEDYFVRCIRRF